MNDTIKGLPKRLFNKFLNLVEIAGNALPHPATLFGLFALAVIVISGIASALEWTAIHPGTKEVIEPVNLMTVDGLHRIILEMVENFTSFAPLGVVLVAMLGIGVAEGSGLIGALIRLLVLSAPSHLLTFILVFSGVFSNLASDVGYVLLIPLAGIIFMSVGRHPIAGMAAAFAGVSGGYSANVLLGTIDPLLAGLSQEAAQIVDPAYTVNATANYYFMFISTFLISIAGTFITEKIVEPRLGEYKGTGEKEEIERIAPHEKKGLIYTLIAALAAAAIILAGLIPEGGFLRPEEGTILQSPLIQGIVTFIFLLAAIGGIAYGIGAGTFKNDSDVIKSMSESMKTMGLYIVIVFFAAQFVAYFKWTNLGVIIAVKGASLLAASGLGVIPIMLLFIVFSAGINMMMGSSSAKWALMAPIFIPMFMLLGYSPELTQVVYRIGDSITNIISPMMSFFALIIAFFQKYDSEAGIGTIISTMLPYTIFFFLIWAVLLIVWLTFGLPLGPDAGLFYQMGS
jgi:aminobenzoyl-glutamate transport protein